MSSNQYACSTVCLPDTPDSVAQVAVTEMLAAWLRLGFHAQVRLKSRQLVAVPTSCLMPERVLILLLPGPWVQEAPRKVWALQ